MNLLMVSRAFLLVVALLLGLNLGSNEIIPSAHAGAIGEGKCHLDKPKADPPNPILYREHVLVFRNFGFVQIAQSDLFTRPDGYMVRIKPSGHWTVLVNYPLSSLTFDSSAGLFRPYPYAPGFATVMDTDIIADLDGEIPKRLLAPLDETKLWAPLRNLTIVGFMENPPSSGLRISDGLIQATIATPNTGGFVLKSVTIPDEIDVKDRDLKDLGDKMPSVIIDFETGFRSGSDNHPEVIRSLKSINDVPISRLEHALSTNFMFLREGDSLLEALVCDNQIVHRDFRLSHHILAEPLFFVRALARRYGAIDRFVYHGKVYKITITPWPEELSPFNDHTKLQMSIKVTNLSTGKSLKFFDISADFIARYGFYGGRGMSSRVSPRQIVDVFDYLDPRQPTTDSPTVH